MVYTENRRFEWSEEKASINFSKHGVTFEIAIEAFDDPDAFVLVDVIHSTPRELREKLIGMSDLGVLVVIFTVREPDGRYRIISARKGNRKETLEYGKRKEK